MTAVADLKAALDPLVDDRVYRDVVPKEIEDPTFPYITIHEGITDARIAAGDGRTTGTAGETQIDVWQLLADEDDTLKPSVETAVNGLRGAGSAVRYSVAFSTRLVEPLEDPVISHWVVTVRAPRSM